MDVSGLVQVISTVGFPIACSVGMAWYVKYITDKNREEVDKLNEQHKIEMADVTQAVNNNTIALTKLCERLDPGGGNLHG